MRLHTPHSALVSPIGPSHFTNYTCSDYSSAGNSAVWDCMKCFEVFVTRLWVLCFNSWQGKTQCWTQTTLFLAVPGIAANFSCLLFSPLCSYSSSLSLLLLLQLLQGACLISNDTTEDTCHGEDRLWYTRGCLSKYGFLTLIGLGLYIIFFLQERSPCHGLSTLRYCGVCMWRNSSNS